MADLLQDWMTSETWKDVALLALLGPFDSEQAYEASLRLINLYRLQKASKKSSIAPPKCFTCDEGPLRTLFLSLHKVYIGCLEAGHMKEFAEANKAHIAVDVARGELFCFACKNYSSGSNGEKSKDQQEGAPQAESSKTDSHLAHKEATGRAQDLLLPRRRVWIPSDYEASTPLGPEPRLMSLQVDLLKEHARSSSSSQGVAGLKGFHNALVHNPGVRDYFLGDYHNRFRCLKKREGEGRQEQVCMGCEMDRLLNDFFQCGKSAYTPHQFLYNMWRSSQHLAGYEQQDAHECFISVLDALHNSCANDVTGEQGAMQNLFRGRMRSDVTCMCCKTSSITRDPFLDISLELRTLSPIKAPSENGSLCPLVQGMFNGADADSSSGHGDSSSSSAGDKRPADLISDESGDTVSLSECLEWFTRVEQLDAQSYRCESCKGYQPGIKQLSIEQLAPSLCIQIKRFESQRGGAGGQQSFKVDTHVTFPLRLNMSPYMSKQVFRGSEEKAKEEEKGKAEAETESCVYHLYAEGSR
ncbi:hypothetical protein GUITHDRAFT_133087 [Guillardia theta CCMP2712]|uniref:ubiquitinyl hydrolase 1 n=1 Tax=Guillardia theta (strain CCMP2712) TaxID=905079 RepID=L1JZ39_GUITC|nr:hypothetical protein GUITHDRAFT_133087 [Guillardia theta CCMP2712]EKX53358.1 hypothetical protein GUITHDRAFT_133087 [Guillardia theta CCMP2712]|eukprot:XP_005840338.1 hypothetical protein GUITHDRAFT_133087 [Guillardia theta CCMP2712]